MILFADVETTGKPKDFKAPASPDNNWPRIVQLAIILAHSDGTVEKRSSIIIKPDGFHIPHQATAVHGITTDYAEKHGYPLKPVLERLRYYANMADYIVCHNTAFDVPTIQSEYLRFNVCDPIKRLKQICTMKSTADYCGIIGHYGYKWPSLQELYQFLFNETFDGAHDAGADIEATRRCFFELVNRNVLKL